MLTKPAGCFVQLVAAGFVFWGLSKFMAIPPSVAAGIVYLAIGALLLALGRRTR